MDTRLLALAASLNLGDGGFNDKEAPLSTPWATNWKVKTLTEMLPLLFEPATSSHVTNSRGSYGLKHTAEHLLRDYAPELTSLHGCWVGNGELILAMAYCGFHSYDQRGPNAYYHLKDKRRGMMNKGGKAKQLAEETETRVKELLRSKVAEQSSA